MSLKSNAVGFVRVGLLALLFSAAYPLWFVIRHHQGAVDLSTIIFRGGLFFILLGVAIKYGLLHEARSSDANPAAAAGAPEAARG